MAKNGMREIVIRHLSGSKANQIQHIPLAGVKEISIGREPTSNIAFNPTRDDVVSRRHAVIRVVGGGDEPISFQLSDLGSHNGTFLNGKRITEDEELELCPDDEIELGENGVKFHFDVQPRPAHMVARTREFDDPGKTRHIKTAEAAAEGAVAKSTTSQRFEQPPKPAIGKETVIRMLGEQRRSTRRVWMSSLAGLAALTAAGGGTVYWQQNRAEKKLRDEMALQAEQAKEQQIKLETTQGLSPQAIVEKFGNGVAQIKRTWAIYYNGRPVFHKTVLLEGQEYPAYVKLPDGSVVRWLTHDTTNIPIGGTAAGSSFVVSDDGLMLTNKHIAAAWEVPFEQEDRANTYRYGWLFGSGKPKKIDLSAEEFKSLRKWIPARDGGLMILNEGVFLGGAARSNPLKGADKIDAFLGRNDRLEITFPGSRVSVIASLSSFSNEADAALIKVNAPQPLTKLDLANNDNVTHGEPVIALGYPAVAASTVATKPTVEAGRFENNPDIVPTPFVTEGIVSTTSPEFKTEKGRTIAGLFGDVIQMSINSTGAGNSGGPVFNKEGKVIGLFTYGWEIGGATTTVAVPIKYGRDLL